MCPYPMARVMARASLLLARGFRAVACHLVIFCDVISCLAFCCKSPLELRCFVCLRRHVVMAMPAEWCRLSGCCNNRTKGWAKHGWRYCADHCAQLGWEVEEAAANPVALAELAESKLAEVLAEGLALGELKGQGFYALWSASGGLSDHGERCLKRVVGKACNAADNQRPVAAYGDEASRCEGWRAACEMLGKALAKALCAAALPPWTTLHNGVLRCWLCGCESDEGHTESQQHRKRAWNPLAYLRPDAPPECRGALLAAANLRSHSRSSSSRCSSSSSSSTRTQLWNAQLYACFGCGLRGAATWPHPDAAGRQDPYDQRWCEECWGQWRAGFSGSR